MDISKLSVEDLLTLRKRVDNAINQRVNRSREEHPSLAALLRKAQEAYDALNGAQFESHTPAAAIVTTLIIRHCFVENADDGGDLRCEEFFCWTMDLRPTWEKTEEQIGILALEKPTLAQMMLLAPEAYAQMLYCLRLYREFRDACTEQCCSVHDVRID